MTAQTGPTPGAQTGAPSAAPTVAVESAAQRTPSFTEGLRQQSEPAWSAAVGHRFTRDLAEGRLAQDVFRRYLVQDYSFLDSFVQLLGAAVAAAPTLADRLPLARFLGVVAGEENTYFQRAFDALSVPEAERTAPARLPATAAFHQVMAEAARSGCYTDMIAVLVVTEWVYLSWAQAVADRTPAPFYFAEWITIHASPTLEAFVGWLRGQLDRDGPTLPEARRQELAQRFRHTVELEVAFFDAAYG